jgi:hypothetical protein
MSSTAADNLCARLVEWDVNTIYGFPGDGINGILGALRRHDRSALAGAGHGRRHLGARSRLMDAQPLDLRRRTA